MHLPLPTLLLLLPVHTLAALNGRCTGSKATGQWKDDGICIKTSTCKKYKGSTKTGACPYDDDDVKCCLIDKCEGGPEEGLGPHSFCSWTTDKGSLCDDFGIWFNNKCPGGSNYKCCLIP
ncbi:hypothetical protein B0T18DRAFT_427205 [Schizothecium vesticola]|uniref:Uncharacterized protein n=1 Tax=Schizothecium vesticola TaxID=314040 RepID=A0AA40F0R1_9PEZI|nr:hypothetical protein B0T18DRAFT_427205 [Schizothecium vesticola]